MTTYYRIHDTRLVRGTTVDMLLDPEMQYSSVWIGSVIRDGVEITRQDGVSVCRTLEDLRDYFALRSAYADEDVVLVELEGVELEDEEDVDAEHGALLVRPTRIVGVWHLDSSAETVDEALALPLGPAEDEDEIEWINSCAPEAV